MKDKYLQPLKQYYQQKQIIDQVVDEIIIQIKEAIDKDYKKTDLKLKYDFKIIDTALESMGLVADYKADLENIKITIDISEIYE